MNMITRTHAHVHKDQLKARSHVSHLLYAVLQYVAVAHPKACHTAHNYSCMSVVIAAVHVHLRQMYGSVRQNQWTASQEDFCMPLLVSLTQAKNSLTSGDVGLL
eukprot:1137222-Pelagomonas_calceolata.AAC.2